MKNIISSKWLLDHIEKENLIILDVRENTDGVNSGFEEYKKGHIKGARYVSFEDVLADKPKAHGGRHPLPDMNKFVENMKALGINDDSIIVIYDDGNLAIAGRLWWMLKYIGKKEVYILKGGLNQWKDNGFELTTEIVTPNIFGTLTMDIDSSMKVEMLDVKEAINSDNIAIVDARAYERYAGKVEPLDKIPGHIPSALNYPWTNLVKNGEIILEDDLEEYFKPLKEFDEIIVHCGSGITGTVNVLFMEEIGLNPKLYIGSYSDWVSYDDNIVVKDELK